MSHVTCNYRQIFFWANKTNLFSWKKWWIVIPTPRSITSPSLFHSILSPFLSFTHDMVISSPLVSTSSSEEENEREGRESRTWYRRSLECRVSTHLDQSMTMSRFDFHNAAAIWQKRIWSWKKKENEIIVCLRG